MTDFEYSIAISQLPTLKTLVAQDVEIRATHVKLSMYISSLEDNLPSAINAYKYMNELKHRFTKAYNKTKFIPHNHDYAHSTLAKVLLTNNYTYASMVTVFQHNKEMLFGRLPRDLLSKLIHIVGLSQIVKPLNIEVVPRQLAIGISAEMSDNNSKSATSRLIELELLKAELGSHSNFTLLEHLLRLARIETLDSIETLQNASSVKSLVGTALTNLEGSL